jgi:hypothetical protein
LDKKVTGLDERLLNGLGHRDLAGSLLSAIWQ